MRELVEIRNLKKEIDRLSIIMEREGSSFNDDLQILLNNSGVQQEKRETYLKQTEYFFKLNKFRNTFAHQLRMIWWKNNKQGKELWGFNFDDYENMRLGKYNNLYPVLIDIFKDHRGYEKTIEELDLLQFKNSSKILQETHDTIAEFLNETFALILPEKPTA